MGKPLSSSSKLAHVSRVGVSMEHDKEPRLSGAYIRTLVKHLTTSVKTKDNSFTPEYPKFPQSLNSNGVDNISQDSPSPPPPPPPPPHRKQVRRRQHTTKPYQERLLNMAEARREIVTALKFHRDSMKQRQAASGDHVISRSPEESAISYPYVAPYYWPIPNNTNNIHNIPPPLPPNNINFTLPNLTLGLNLNFHDFKIMDNNNLYHNPPSNYYSTSSFSSSSSSSLSTSISAVVTETTAVKEVTVAEEVMTTSATASSATTVNSSSMNNGLNHVMDDERIVEEMVPTTTSSATSITSSLSGGLGLGLHQAVDDEGMEEIRSLGEKHQIEWNDTVNLLMFARWFSFLKSIEIEQEDWKFDNEVNPFDDEFSPCMDISEIEGLDGEWLA